MKFPYLALIFLTLGFCSPPDLRQGAQPPKSEAPSKAEVPLKVENEIRIPKAQNKDGPISIWLKELSSPRLYSNRNLSLKCQGNPTQLTVIFSESLPICKKIAQKNIESTPFTLICLSATKLLIGGLKKPCDPLDLSPLQHIKDLAETSLYERSPEKSAANPVEKSVAWVPAKHLNDSVRSALPNFIESEEKVDLQIASFSPWVGQSSSSGVFAMDLELPLDLKKNSNPDTRLNTLQILEYLQKLSSNMMKDTKAKKWGTMNFSLSPAIISLLAGVTQSKDIKSLSENESKNFYFFTLKASSQSPLFQQACKEMGDWMQSVQLLADDAPIAKKVKKIELQCHFRLSDERSEHPFLRVTHFPMPLVFENSGRYPIKTLDELRSVAVLQSFRVLR